MAFALARHRFRGRSVANVFTFLPMASPEIVTVSYTHLTLPLSMPGLVAGTLLTFIPAAGDYINAELLGNTRTQMVGNVIQNLFDGGSYPEAAALSVTLMSVIVVMVLVYIWRSGTEELV